MGLESMKPIAGVPLANSTAPTTVATTAAVTTCAFASSSASAYVGQGTRLPVVHAAHTRGSLAVTNETKGAYAIMKIRYILSTRYSCYQGNDPVMSSIRHLIKALVDEVRGQDALDMLAILDNPKLSPETRYQRLQVFKTQRSVRRYWGL